MKLVEALHAYGLRVETDQERVDRQAKLLDLTSVFLPSELGDLRRMAQVDERCWLLDNCEQASWPSFSTRIQQLSRLIENRGIDTSGSGSHGAAYDDWMQLASEYRRLQCIHKRPGSVDRQTYLQRIERMDWLHYQLTNTTPGWRPIYEA